MMQKAAKILILTLLFYFNSNCNKNENEMELEEVPRGGNFTLQSSDGPFSLSDLKGNIVFLYFGFMSCPDVCPTTLNVFSAAFKNLSKEDESRVRFVFIDVDPDRDTLDRLVVYTKYFHPQIIPVTGTLNEISDVAKLYGGSFQKIKLQSSMGYTIDHTSSVFVIDQSGKWIKTLPHGIKKSEIQKTILELLNDNAKIKKIKLRK